MRFANLFKMNVILIVVLVFLVVILAVAYKMYWCKNLADHSSSHHSEDCQHPTTEDCDHRSEKTSYQSREPQYSDSTELEYHCGRGRGYNPDSDPKPCRKDCDYYEGRHVSHHPMMYRHGPEGVVDEHRTGIYTAATTTGPPTPGPTGALRPSLTYSGGPVMTGNNIIYPIFYGNTWGTASALSDRAKLIMRFFEDFRQSPYYVVNQQFSQVVKKVRTFVGPITSVAAPKVTPLNSKYKFSTNDGIDGTWSVVVGTYPAPYNPNGLYLVIPDAGVKIDGFETQYCGWHDFHLVSDVNVKF